MTRKISDILYQIKGNPKSKLKIIHHDRMRRFKASSIPQCVLSLQQNLRTGNTFLDSDDTKTIRKRKQKPNKLIQKRIKTNKDQNLSNQPEIMTGRRKRKPPERLQM